MYKSKDHHKKNDDIPLNHSIPPMSKDYGSVKPQNIITKTYKKS